MGIRPVTDISEHLVDLSLPFEVTDVVCLGCGLSYRKPTTHSFWDDDPGCPRCGYTGWADRADFPRIRSKDEW
jgi:hypothetical protein